MIEFDWIATVEFIIESIELLPDPSLKFGKMSLIIPPLGMICWVIMIIVKLAFIDANWLLVLILAFSTVDVKAIIVFIESISVIKLEYDWNDNASL